MIDHRESALHGEVVGALLTMLSARDAATCDHSIAAGEWARRLALAIGLSEEQSSAIEVAAILHDIGKIATPDHILLKPGALDDEEWVTMREHAGHGETILSRFPSLQDYAHIVGAHHEHYDGSGYPRGLGGDSIPLGARVVAVADGYHAMISTRPYRTAMTSNEALVHLVAGGGTVWDPTIVRHMVALVAA